MKKKRKMKRVFKTVCLIAMVGLVAVSCKKKEDRAEYAVNFGETYGFQAGPSLDGSKAYFDPYDGYKFKWNVGDEVVIYNLATDHTQSTCEVFSAMNAGQESMFMGKPVGARKDIGYFVFYNAEKAHRDLKEFNTETFEVKRTQTYDPACLADPTAIVAACTTGENNGEPSSFSVQHIFGYLNVAIGGLSEGVTVDSIVVTDNRWNLTGQLDLRLPQVNSEEFTTLLGYLKNYQEDEYTAALNTYLHQLGYHAHGNQTKSIKLDCGGAAVPYLQWQYFFVCLRPGALYKGFSVDIYLKGNNGNNHLHKDFTPSNNWLIEPAKFNNIFIGTDGQVYG